jgi:predicted ATPase
VPCPPAIDARPPFPFVGRDAERQELDEVWAAARAGQRRTVLIGGEPGAGKTRLAFEFARRCAAEEAIVLLGVCDTELAIPYQPWAGALEQLIEAMPTEVRAALAEPLAEVLPLVPQLERALPGLHRGPSGDPETERYRLFHGVDAVLAAAATSAPVVLVIDDLHWAGAPTLAMLRHLARSASATPLLIIGTFRTPATRSPTRWRPASPTCAAWTRPAACACAASATTRSSGSSSGRWAIPSTTTCASWRRCCR